MSEAPFSAHRLATAYIDTTQGALPRLTKQIARMIARAFQQQTRHVIAFGEAVPGQGGGELLDTAMPFIVENYLTVADFWEEYEGASEPSSDPAGGWSFPTFGDIMRREIPAMLVPHYTQALVHLQREEPTYYGQLATYIHSEYDDAAHTPEELVEEIHLNDVAGAAETTCEGLVSAHVQTLLLASLLQKQRIPRRCQRTVLAGIPPLAAFMEELASYCSTVAHVTSVNQDGPLQLHLERTDAGVIFGEYEGARELLMDHMAHEGSLILRSTLAETDGAGAPLAGVRGWFITADATRVTPHRIVPDDLYDAMNTDAQTGAKLPPEPHVRYL